jgi:hypothetical protein
MRLRGPQRERRLFVNFDRRPIKPGFLSRSENCFNKIMISNVRHEREIEFATILGLDRE